MYKITALEKSLKEDYAKFLQSEFLKKHQENKRNKTDSEFLNAFRPNHKPSEIKETTTKSLIDEYSQFVDSQVSDYYKKINEISGKIAYEKFLLHWERKILRINHENLSGEATRYYVDRINQHNSDLKLLIKESPEAWIAFYKKEWLTDIKCQKEQQLVPVPYVTRTKEKVIECLEKSQPVYLVGHLGSGKTQLAIEAAVDYVVQEKIQVALEEEMEHWFNKHQEASKYEAYNHFLDEYTKQISLYERIRKAGTKEERQQLEPLFISGSHNLTYEDMFVEKTLSLEQHFNQDSFSDYLNEMVVDYLNWMTEHGTYSTNLSSEEALQLRVQIWKSFSDLFIAKNNSFGTTVKKIEREILIAIKEGRPVIVDELNTIAMQNLIALNDLLQRHVGQTAYITGVGPIEIKQGFGFIGTGNLSTDLIHYEGTNQLNPAFQSRFVTIEYNYVPQQLSGELKFVKKNEENELFRVILSTLANDDGSIELPQKSETLDELFRFAQLSRLTQEVFMGKYVDNEESESTYSLGLKEAVLSIRNIMHVLNSWNYGEEKCFSKALWDGFISSITYPSDQYYILSQALRFGFFKETDGWQLGKVLTYDRLVSYEELRLDTYSYQRGQTEILSYFDVINILFTQPEKRKKPLPFLNEENLQTNVLNVKDIQEVEKKLQSLEYTKTLYDYLNKGEDSD